MVLAAAPMGFAPPAPAEPVPPLPPCRTATVRTARRVSPRHIVLGAPCSNTTLLRVRGYRLGPARVLRFAATLRTSLVPFAGDARRQGGRLDVPGIRGDVAQAPDGLFSPACLRTDSRCGATAAIRDAERRRSMTVSKGFLAARCLRCVRRSVWQPPPSPDELRELRGLEQPLDRCVVGLGRLSL
jgi:hypothetical protein